MQPAAAQAQPPHPVAQALAEVVADVFGGQPLQGGEVRPLKPVATDEAAQEVLHHAWESEDAFVDRVVHGAKLASCQGRVCRLRMKIP